MPDNFKEFYTLYYKSLCLFVNARINDSGVSEEICNDVFLIAHEKNIPAENMKAFLFICAKNKSIDFIRKKGRDASFNKEIKPDYEIENEIDNVILDAAYLSRLYAELEKLPERQKIVIAALYFKNKKYHEVGAEIGISTRAVTDLRKKALSFLNKSLSKTHKLFNQ